VTFIENDTTVATLDAGGDWIAPALPEPETAE
jgi:hypothetical protein